MIVAVIQARMSSVRFPGKVVHVVEGKPLLQYAVERIRHAANVGQLVVATSDRPDDDPVAELCAHLEASCVRGPLEDVAGRFLEVFQRHPADGYVRVSGDSPMIDPAVIDEVVARFNDVKPDLATNVFPRTFPKGMSVEVLEPNAYRRAYARFTSSDEREHVTAFLYRHPGEFRIANVASGGAFNDRDLSVDVPEQAQRLAALLRLMNRPHWTYGWKELLELWERAGAVRT